MRWLCRLLGHTWTAWASFGRWPSKRRCETCGLVEEYEEDIYE